MINEKSFGFWIVIAGLAVMLVISLVSVFRYTSAGMRQGPSRPLARSSGPSSACMPAG
jgi:hypothetical protein